MGGDNTNWEGTPLYVLHSKYLNKGKSLEEANKSAGIDGGWLLKKILNDDKEREFASKPDGWIAEYQWVNL